MNGDLEILVAAVREAGTAIVEMRRQGVTVSMKANHDVLTQADLLANQILHSRLHHAFPDDGWLSEETVDDAARLRCKRVWVVDPIDGTREYIAGIPEYAVSVALVEDGLPLLAAVFNPESSELFSAVRGQGAWLNGKPVQCKQQCTAPMVLLASRSEYQRGEWERFRQHDVKIIGSIAYKLALVAAGLADATFSLGPKSEWDIAAGVLLITEGGGAVTDKSNHPFVFNQEIVKVNGIIASSRIARQQLIAAIG
jgi:myo-inositol-1(or 4)-monophosphatase